MKMKSFQQGILIGLLLSVVLTVAIALTLNDERRRKLRYRLEKLRDAVPGMEQIKQTAQETAIKARETGSNLGKQVQESSEKLVQQARETGNNLGKQVQESSDKLAQHAQEILNTVQQKASSLDKK